MRSTLLRTGLVAASILIAIPGWATIFSSIRGLIHDPQHRPVAGAQVIVRAVNSSWSKTAETNPSGEFVFDSVHLRQAVDVVDA